MPLQKTQTVPELGRSPALPPPALGDEPTGLYGRPIPLPRWRLNAGRFAGLAAVLAGGQYMAWRLGTLQGTGWLGMVFWVAEAVNLLCLVATLALIWRAPARPRPINPPEGTLDVFITVCGEPADMVEKTVRAALAIAYPHQTYVLNDGRIASKANWRDVERMADRVGVECFSRTTGARGKAANLNHALSLTEGDYVVTIDADHPAVESLATQTLGYFADPRVAFVTTPQQFEAIEDAALNNQELFFYRVIQPAKDAANSAFSCGNAVVYRRRGLESIGGFSEWNTVEDVHTSYELHARGWSSVYHNSALTTGTAPPNLAELVRQRSRWATDSARLLFWDNPLVKRGLSWRQRFHYLHTTGFYALMTTQILFVVSPALYLLAGVAIMRVTDVNELLARSVPYYVAVALCLAAYCGPRETFNVIRQQLVLAPVYLWAVGRALLARPVPNSVTEKVRPPSLSWGLVPPALLLGLSLVALASAVADPGEGRSTAGVWAAWFAVALAGPLAAVSRSRRGRRWTRAGLYAVVASALAVLALPGLNGLLPEPRRALALPRSGVYLGMTNAAALQGPDQLAAWNRRHGIQARIVNSYQQWFSGDTRFRADRARMIAEQGGVNMITWEPWAKPVRGVHDAHQPRARLQTIIEGRHDRYIEEWARAAAAYRGPLLIRFLHEMNGDWYPWAYGTNGNTMPDVIAAWRHVHDVFARAGATNVRWVWTINSFAGLEDPERNLELIYPGSRYVDWVSATGFNWGRGHPRRSVQTVFDSTLRSLDRLGKPIMLSEVGTVANRGDPGPWIRQALYDLPRSFPRLKAIVWFDDRYNLRSDFSLRGRNGKAFDSIVARDPALRAPLRLTTAPD